MMDPLQTIYEGGTGVLESEDESLLITEQENEAEAAPVEHLVSYLGFGSGSPYLLEKPTAYVNRMAKAAQTLILPNTQYEDDTPATRILYSPALSLPFVLPQQGDLMYRHSRYYPLLNMPEQRFYTDVNIPIDAYALTVIIAYKLPDISYMGESKNGDLVTWDDIGRYAVPDKYWSQALHLVEAIYQPLTALNLARLVRFAQHDTIERKQLAILCKSWGIDDTPKTLLTNGDQAIDTLAEYWDQLCPETTFNPYE